MELVNASGGGMPGPCWHERLWLFRCKGDCSDPGNRGSYSELAVAGGASGGGYSCGAGCTTASNEVVGQPLYKATMSVRRDRPDRPEKIADGEHHQEAKADKRGSLQAAGSEIRIARPYHLVKAPSLVVKLCADSADKKIPMRRHRPENDSRAILDLPVSLGQRRQYNVSFGHRRRSSVSYTGSSVP